MTNFDISSHCRNSSEVRVTLTYGFKSKRYFVRCKGQGADWTADFATIDEANACADDARAKAAVLNSDTIASRLARLNAITAGADHSHGRPPRKEHLRQIRKAVNAVSSKNAWRLSIDELREESKLRGIKW